MSKAPCRRGDREESQWRLTNASCVTINTQAKANDVVLGREVLGEVILAHVAF